MFSLSTNEQSLMDKMRELKREAGSHSPSRTTIQLRIPEIKTEIDACFLSNPYATEVFMKYLKRELLETGAIYETLEFYPSQNKIIAEVLAPCVGVPKEKIFIGNGAIEIIQAVLQKFDVKSIVINLPTFSSYYEFVPEGVDVHFHYLSKKDDFQLDVQSFVRTVQEKKADSVVIINPNNPDGGYIPLTIMREICSELRDCRNVIVDESFIHFAYEDSTFENKSTVDLTDEFPNLIVVKSMSKDFGIAGVRAGYAVMSENRVHQLLDRGFLWNFSGLAEYFFRLYVREKFQDEYKEVRIRYIQETIDFFDDLKPVKGLIVYPSKANFALVELPKEVQADEFMTLFLIRYGIYVRSCSDKRGLEGQFLRIASRRKKENQKIINAFEDLFGKEPETVARSL